ncbi:MAG: lipopolysaccharide biosynthesis protein [Clostridium sp.]|uniref:lipopolysaccharide biosynthesis protein n=1 Tax=Clostridium sp. TaxID=1506 RepID=UPI003EE6CDAF
MKEKASKNLQLNLFITIITAVLGFISNKYFSKYLGMENLGLMRLFTQLIAYLSLADLGINSAATYALYKPLSEKNYEKLSLVVSTINSFYKKISLIILFVGLILNILIPSLIKTSIDGKAIYIYWSLYVINTSITYIFAKYSILFIANQEYGFVRKISGFSGIFFQVLQIISLVYIKSFLVYISINLLNNLICFYFYKKHYKKYYSYINSVQQRDENIIKDTKNMFTHKIGGLVVSNTDYIVLAKFTTLSIIAKYSSYLTIYAMIMTFTRIITSVITPLVGKFIATESKENIYKYWSNLYSVYMFLGTILTISTYILIEPFINLWLGEDYILSNTTTILILINLFVSITRSPLDIFKDCSGFFDDIYTPVFESLINLIISLALVVKIGLNGVIIGTICSNIIIIYIVKPILVFQRCFEKNATDYLIKLSKNISLVLLAIFLSVNIIGLLDLNITTWMEFLKICFIVGFITTAISFLVFILDSNFRKYILDFKVRL